MESDSRSTQRHSCGDLAATNARARQQGSAEPCQICVMPETGKDIPASIAGLEHGTLTGSAGDTLISPLAGLAGKPGAATWRRDKGQRDSSDQRQWREEGCEDFQ